MNNNLYTKLRERYHSKSGMYLNKEICTDLEVFINRIVIEELDEQLELAEHYNASEKLSERIYELKQERL